MKKFNIYSINIRNNNKSKEKIYSLIDSKFLYLNDEPFTKREAWCWLITESTHNELSCSIRYMADIWKWHRSKVERFLNRIKSESLIKTEIRFGKLHIILNKIITDRDLPETENESASRHNIENERYSQDDNSDNEIQANSALSEDSKIDARQDHLQEEKKKRTKKRKEEIKEKNIPYRDIKKEKIIENCVPFELVTISDIEIWAAKALTISLNLQWELDKFKDYYLSDRNKPPKNGIAAFRNWLRKAEEFKIEEKKNAKFNTKITGSSFERFLAGGARAIASYEKY